MIVFDKEGETPLDDISGLKIKGITTRSQLDEVEAENILDAFLKYTRQALYQLMDDLKFWEKAWVVNFDIIGRGI